jgi:2-O-(6-phospho-alpha-D-mannosyl)-D-glycerate hydrolase
MTQPAEVVVVSHFHWDREWYRTMQGFRARLVDAIDQVLDLASVENDYRFLLDGQTVVLDDYLVVRPERRAELVEHIQAGRLSIGPWFVQPDSLLPSGEAHIRNLLEGRRAEAAFGPVSRVAYVPDSFGHPAQFPQLFAGFGLTGFVHWRGNGNELDTLGPRWSWRAPDGSTIPVFHLTEGYFAASRPPTNRSDAAAGLTRIIGRLQEAGENPAIVMNGFDHTRPDPGIGDLLAAVSAELDRPVVRGTLDDAVAAATTTDAQAEFAGELVGGRIANLLPGVWSTRMPLKIRNREIEDLLQRWAEPWTALGCALGLPDETPSIREAWRSLLLNQAHDSICGCSIDAVHDRMTARYDDAEGLASETVLRVLERLAGRSADRDVPGIDDLEIVVFNASPRPASGVVRVPIDAHPAFSIELGAPVLHSLVEAGMGEIGFTLDGVPVRVIESDDPTRVRWFPGQSAFDIEFVATDVPAFGCRRYRLERGDPVDDTIDDGAEISNAGIRVEVADDGTVTIETAAGVRRGCFGVEDTGDRGDSYDFDPVGEPTNPSPARVTIVRHRHESGIERLLVDRTYRLPAGLTPDRAERTEATVETRLSLELTVAPGVPGVHVSTILDNTARDHRLRLTFPAGGPVGGFLAATTLDLTTRSTDRPDNRDWVHPAPTTFCNQGAVSVNGLTVIAPGLPEAEVGSDGTLALTLVRAVGWLARYDLTTRPMPAGPEMETPGAQCIGEIATGIVLTTGDSHHLLEAGRPALWGAIGGPDPLLADGHPLVEIDDEETTVTAVKPAADGSEMVMRMLNPTDHERRVTIRFGLEISEARSVRLDESDDGVDLDQVGSTVALTIGAHQLRTIRFAAAATTPLPRRTTPRSSPRGPDRSPGATFPAPPTRTPPRGTGDSR